MKIAHLLPASVTFPLDKPHARHAWVIELARIQTNAGHDVTIFAGQGSVDASAIRWRSQAPASNDPTQNNIALVTSALNDSSFDIFHSHFDNLHYTLGHLTNKPIVFTQHWWPYEPTVELARTYTGANIWAVPPTRYMYDFDQQNGIQSQGHIYHGINLSLFQHPIAQKNGRLLVVGRISPEKNLETCIKIAKKANLGLDIIGKVIPKTQPYLETLLPMIDGEQIVYHGTKTQPELVAYYAAAQALLFPADGHEAFGLVAIESQACGTPVIMERGGSRGELVNDGITGFLCESLDEYVNAAHASAHIKPGDCYEFAKKFDVQIMAELYESLYNNLANYTS